MKWLKNPWVARAIALILIVSGVWISANRTLGRMYENTVSVWKAEGGIREELESKAGDAANLITVAGRYLSEADVEPLEESRQALIDSLDDPEAAGQAGSLVTEYALDIEEALLKEELSEKDREYVRGSVSEILAADEIIGHSTYNETCEAYNTTLEGFPARILARFTGTEKAGLYTGNR